MRASALVGRVVVLGLVASPAIALVACGGAGMEEDPLGETSAASGGDPAPLSQIVVPAPVGGDIVNAPAAIRLGKSGGRWQTDGMRDQQLALRWVKDIRERCVDGRRIRNDVARRGSCLEHGHGVRALRRRDRRHRLRMAINFYLYSFRRRDGVPRG